MLGEKPISNEIAKAEEMVAKAEEKGVCYGINLNHRFTPAAYLAKEWLDEGRLGHLLFFNMSMWIMNPRESSPYFQLKALHPHTVDVMRYFCGDVEAVQCFATKAPGREIWSTATFNMRFKNGVVGTLTGSYDIERGHPMERCEVAGTGGRLVIDDMWREATSTRRAISRRSSTPIRSLAACATSRTPSATASTASSSRWTRASLRLRSTAQAPRASRRRRCWPRRSSRWIQRQLSTLNRLIERGCGRMRQLDHLELSADQPYPSDPRSIP